MYQLTPAQSADLEAFLDEQLADLGLSRSEERQLRQRIRQIALDDLRGHGLVARPPRPEPAPRRHVAA